MIRRNTLFRILLLTLVGLSLTSWFVAPALATVARFPKPEFETDYVYPTPSHPEPDPGYLNYVTVAVLVVGLSLSAYFSIRRRNRRWLFVLMLVCLAYFGFWREGCVCMVGSLQNVVLAIADADYSIGWPILAFFSLPLVFALFFGRAFCAGVCPLGAVQDVVIVKPVRIPRWLSQVLGMIPYLYLALTVLFAATGAGFLICRYDPFVALFRLSGSIYMLIFGLIVLGIGMIIARPYCRFLCPYGVLLGWLSALAKFRVTITPNECIQCRLCEDACPFDAIEKPFPQKLPETRAEGIKRLAVLFAALPLLIIGVGWLGSMMNVPLSQMHPRVALAEEIAREDASGKKSLTVETRTFRGSGVPTNALYAEATAIRDQFRVGGWFAGAFIGLVIGIKLIFLSMRPLRKDYEPSAARCLSCGRCFDYCPKEHERLRQDTGNVESTT